jgi:hypothetical protein
MNGNSKHMGLRIAALVVVVGVLLIGGVRMTRAAAKTAIPGDALYPVKTTLEQTRLSLAQDAGDRAQLKMGFAELRLDEIAALIEEGRYHLVNEAVLAFEADINSAILELATVAQVDTARAARIALEIAASLTRYAQTLSVMAVNAPEGVQSEVARALDTTQIAAGLQLPASGVGIDDNSNGNENDANASLNDSGDDGNGNSNSDDGNSNSNTNGNHNDNGNDNDSGANENDNGGANGNSNDGDDNSNGDDDGGANGNASGADDNANGDDDNSNGDDDGGANSNGSGESGNSNDDGGNSHGGNDNGDDDSSGSGNGNNDDGGDDNDNGDDNGNGDD